MVIQFSNISMTVRVTGVALIGVALLGIALVGITEANLDDEMRMQASARQESNMAVAWEALRHRGGEFSVIGNKLQVGTYQINDTSEVVDRIQTLVGGVATVFMGDVRVATNVKKPDGSRAIGTKLAQGAVYDAMFRYHKPYRGEVDILGEKYFSAYDPILNASREVIGVLFVGIKQSDYLAVVPRIIFRIGMFVAVAAFILCTTIGLLIRRLLSPLNEMVDAMRRLSEDDLNVTIPASGRRDEVGRMGLAALIHEYFRQIQRILLTRFQIEVHLTLLLVTSLDPVIFSLLTMPMTNVSAASVGRC